MCVGTLCVSDGNTEQNVETYFSLIQLITPLMPQQRRTSQEEEKGQEKKKKRIKLICK